MAYRPGIQSAVVAADRARLLRFLTTAEPRQSYWKAGERVTADQLSTAALRDAVFCSAMAFRDTRRSARIWRAFHAFPGNVHRGAPAGCTTVPSYSGAALDRWLARPEAPAFAIAAE